MIELISAMSSIGGVADIQPSDATYNMQQPKTNFADWVADEMSVVNGQINTAELNLREFAAGQTDNLHQVMLSLNKAKLSFEMMVEVRNKTLEGYQQIMRMQI